MIKVLTYNVTYLFSDFVQCIVKLVKKVGDGHLLNFYISARTFMYTKNFKRKFIAQYDIFCKSIF